MNRSGCCSGKPVDPFVGNGKVSDAFLVAVTRTAWFVIGAPPAAPLGNSVSGAFSILCLSKASIALVINGDSLATVSSWTGAAII
jgi:hypothetical protein